jgi:hypothetical protein
MITISTVSYGDILPSSGSGIHEICTMILGCGCFGFVFGSMASIISNKD